MDIPCILPRSVLIVNESKIDNWIFAKQKGKFTCRFYLNSKAQKDEKQQKFEKFRDFKDFRLQKFNIQKNSREFLKSQRDENKVWIHLSALFQPSLKLQKDLWSPIMHTIYFLHHLVSVPLRTQPIIWIDWGTLKSENYRDIITVQW